MSSETLNDLKRAMDEYRNNFSVLSYDLAYGSINRKRYAREVLLRAFHSSAVALNENNQKSGREPTYQNQNQNHSIAGVEANYDQK